LDLSEEEACAILEISADETESTSGENGEGDDESKSTTGKIFGRVDEEILKRQYRRLAMRYHPDKNPQGREKFVAVQKAYERLQATLQGLQGPQPWRLQLLLKAQCILFSRYGAVLEPFKYAGYPMLLNVITIDRDDNTFLTPERAPLLEAATELIWLTCCSSALNGEELVRDGGISLLATLLSRCMNVVQRTTASTDSAAVIVSNIMRTFAGLSTFESARQEMLHYSGFVVDVVHCCELELATTAVEAALQTVAHLAASSKLQDALLKAGVIWFLTPLLLQYDSTAEHSSATGPQIGNSIQTAKNMHAMLAVRALARLAGLLDDELHTPPNEIAAKALRAMLTPKLAAMFSHESPRDLLRNLNSNVESPQIIWNSAMRAELLNFVENQRMSQLADGTYDMQAVQDFKYKALTSELHVGDVYLRVYNEQPDSEIANGQQLCEALVDYISNVVEARQKLGEVEVLPEPQPATQTVAETSEDGAPPVPVEDSSEEDAQTKEGEEKGGESASSVVSADVPSPSTSESPGKTLVKNLTMALKALQNILSADSELTSVFSSKERLAPLLNCLLDTGPSSDEVPQLCLDVLARLTMQASCVEALVADRSALLLLLQLLHCAPACRSDALRVLYSLASTSELAWAAAKHGGVVYILQLILPGQEVSSQTRIAAASLLGKLVGQPMHGPRVAITVARFLPDGLVSAIRDGPGDAVVAALEQSSETPELVWSPAMAASLGAQLATMAADLYREQTKGKVVEWDLPESSSGQQDNVNEEPQVGGVYVRLFLKDPKFPLRNPKRFLEGLLDQYVTAAAATHARGGSQVDPQLPLLLSAALVSLLRVQPLLADHVAHLGYVPKLVSAMANEGRIVSSASSQNVLAKSGSHGRQGEPSMWDVDDADSSLFGNQTPQEQVRLSCLRVLHQLAASTACAEAMATPGMGSPQIVPLLMKAIGWPGGSVLALETLKRVVAAGNRARDALVAQGLKAGLVEVLLGILDWRAGGRNGLMAQMKWNENEASVGRVLAVEVLQAFAGEGAHSARVQDVLSSSDVWSAYKDQKHDLFLPSNAQTAAAGIAGLIEGSSGNVKYALPQPSSRSAMVKLSGSHSPGRQ
jgi:DnaJ family protein C protein 13